ncbi:MAG TPA: sulfotransferase [Bacteroidetes bacterium]|nr:sulfotransferase [Bacteroidota bacterium]
MILEKIKKFRKRNKGRVWRKLGHEVGGRVYKKRIVRKILSSMYSPREPKKWIFIVGCYNSGTSILREILGSHPDVSALPFEGATLTDEFRAPEDLGWTRNWLNCVDYVSLPAKVDAEKKKKLLKDWAPLWSRKSSVFLEKTISNIERMEWIDMNLDNVYFLGITRNGYASIEGMKRKAAPKGNARTEYKKDQYDYSFVAKQWGVANMHLFENAKNVKRFKHIFYEEMVANSEHVFKEIFSYLELDSSPYKFEGNKISVGNTSFVLKNMNFLSFKNLSNQDMLEIEAEVKEQLELFSYDRE